MSFQFLFSYNWFWGLVSVALRSFTTPLSPGSFSSQSGIPLFLTLLQDLTCVLLFFFFVYVQANLLPCVFRFSLVAYMAVAMLVIIINCIIIYCRRIVLT